MGLALFPSSKNRASGLENSAPCVLLWETWKARNAALFDDIRPSIQKLTHRISWWLEFIQARSLSSSPVPPPTTAHSSSHQPTSRVFPSPTTPLLQGLPSIHPSREQASISAVVKWLQPPPGWTNINVDGLALGNPGPFGGGGICRDENGAFLFAFHEGYSLGSNVHAELRAIHDGLLLCFSKGLKNIILELDSQLLIDFLTGRASPGWKWRFWISRINQLVASGHVKFAHILREGNALADAMAKLGSQEQSSRLLISYTALSPLVRGLLFLNKVGLGSIRP
ncbi:uncharacterized protein LOC131225019 [Magnolia sinica]|uniref:uncharacterized protein LOC131225019 n=1 Tax=Magnolia sinica TaxID=86752 RepID=UPI002659E8E3|nr:uncharacterized protein LOC131225019 [Magnolia sinica]